MPWELLAEFDLTSSWQYTDPLSSPLIRVRQVSQPSPRYRGLWGHSVLDDTDVLHPFQTSGLSGVNAAQLIALPHYQRYPDGRLALRRLDTSSLTWSVAVEQWNPTMGTYPPFYQDTRPETRRDGSPLQQFDRWFSTQDNTWYFWSFRGRWWSEKLFTVEAPITSLAPIVTIHHLQLTRLILAGKTGATNNAANHWVFNLQQIAGVNVTTISNTTLNTSAIAANRDFSVSRNLDVFRDTAAGLTSFQILAAPVGSPSPLAGATYQLEYRRVAPPSWT